MVQDSDLSGIGMKSGKEQDMDCRFEKYYGQDREVDLARAEQQVPVAIIGMKAFLSCKTVEKLILPETLETVEDWGFAHMKNLREITLPAKKIAFGKQVFLGCDRLRRILLTADTELYAGIPFFLASMFRFFPEGGLENLEMAGAEEGQWEWLAAYDKALNGYIDRPDDYGFEPAFIGWFDIEDVDDQKNNYMLEQRKNKIRLALQRLRYGEGLSGKDRDFLQQFLCRENELTEELFLDETEELGGEIAFYTVWQEAGGLDCERAGRLLDRLPETQPEIRAYLLKIQLEHTEGGGFFEELRL